MLKAVMSVFTSCSRRLCQCLHHAHGSDVSVYIMLTGLCQCLNHAHSRDVSVYIMLMAPNVSVKHHAHRGYVSVKHHAHSGYVCVYIMLMVSDVNGTYACNGHVMS